MASAHFYSPLVAIAAAKLNSRQYCGSYSGGRATSAFIGKRTQLRLRSRRSAFDLNLFKTSTVLCEPSRNSVDSRMAAAEPAIAETAGQEGSTGPLPELMTEFMVDMKCDGCVKNVRGRLEPVEGVSQVEVDLDNQLVRVLASSPLKDLMAALEATGRKNRVIGQGSPRDMELTAAVAEFKGPIVFGVVRFAQVSQEMTRVEAQIDGLTPGAHGWSINTYGDLTNGPESTGGHYNPQKIVHGAPDCEIRHVGDLGNVVANDEGQAEYSGKNDKIKVWDLIGRAVVIYEHEDDLGRGSDPESTENGCAGKGLAAAVIARSAGVGQNHKILCSCDGTVIWEATPNDYVAAK